MILDDKNSQRLLSKNLCSMNILSYWQCLNVKKGKLRKLYGKSKETYHRRHDANAPAIDTGLCLCGPRHRTVVDAGLDRTGWWRRGFFEKSHGVDQGSSCSAS